MAPAQQEELIRSALFNRPALWDAWSTGVGFMPFTILSFRYWTKYCPLSHVLRCNYSDCHVLIVRSELDERLKLMRTVPSASQGSSSSSSSSSSNSASSQPIRASTPVATAGSNRQHSPPTLPALHASRPGEDAAFRESLLCVHLSRF
jgi:hypothetical protein